MPNNKKIQNLLKDASNLPKDKWLKNYAMGGETDNINQNNNQVYTYKTNPNYFDNKAVIHENPKYNELIKKSIYAGTHGYNPSTGELIKLKNKIEVPQETQLISTKEYGKASEKERFAVNPELRKQYIQKSTKEAYENPLMSAPGIIGMGPLAGPGFEVAYGLSGALSNLAAGNYGTAGLMGGLSALPFLRNAKILTKPKKLTSSVDNVIENTNNQLPPPPSEIQFMPDGTTRTVYNQQPITDYVSGSYRPDYINLRRLINEHVPSELNIRTASSEEIQRFANNVGMSVDDFTRFAESTLPRNINLRRQPLVNNTFDLNKLIKTKNKSGLTKEEVLAKASAKNKDVISKMSEDEFSNTVLKPTGEIVPYESQANLMPHFTGSNNVFAMSPKEYADRFNENIDLLNDIITQKNKSGVQYRVKGIDEHGKLTFYTPEQTVPKNFTKKELENIKLFEENPIEYLKNKANLKKVNDVYVLKDGSSFESIDDVVKYVKDYLEEFKKPQTISGESTWSVGINPGEWRGNVEDIANTEYFRSIPGLEMSNTTSGVFADNIARKGTGAYESINEYLKKLDLGRVKPGFNSQTEFSRGAWENFIKTGRGVGFYNNPRTIYGTMKNLLLPVVGTGIIGSELMKEEKPKQKLSQGGKVTKFGLSDKFNEIFKSEYSKGGYNLDKKASKLKDSFKPKFHTVDKNVAKSKSTDFEMYMRNYQHGGRLIPTSDRPIFNLKYSDGGKINTLEGDLISKVIMERNKNKDFVKRAYAFGQYPKSNMFSLPDPDEFGSHMTHKMSWGEDDKGQAYMFPEVLNPNNEVIKIPNQYADYITSEGYKKVTGIPIKKSKGGKLKKYEGGGYDKPYDPESSNTTQYAPDPEFFSNPEAAASANDYLVDYGGRGNRSSAQTQPTQKPAITVSDPNHPRLRAYSDSLNLYNKEKKLYEEETKLSYDKLLKTPHSNIPGEPGYGYTFSGKPLYGYKKPVQPVIYQPNVADILINSINSFSRNTSNTPNTLNIKNKLKNKRKIESIKPMGLNIIPTTKSELKLKKPNESLNLEKQTNSKQDKRTYSAAKMLEILNKPIGYINEGIGEGRQEIKKSNGGWLDKI